MRNRGDAWEAEIGACERVNDAGDQRTFWWRVEARGSSFEAKFFRFCKSRTAGLSGDATLAN